MDNGRTRLQKAHEDVTEVKDIMMVNLQKAEERSGKLDDLETRADDMLVKSRDFERTAQKVKQKKRWDNVRMKVMLVGAAVVAVSVIFGIIIYFSVTSANGE